MTDPLRLDFIPGTLCDERVWGRLVPLLPSRFLPSFVPLYEARTRMQMRELIAGSTAPAANIVAFSMGAYLALEHALAHPERVRSLVLIGGSARGLLPEEKQRRRRTMAVLETHPFVGMPPSQLRGFVHPAHLADPAIAPVIHRMALDLGKETMLAQFLASMERPDLMERLAELRCPLLLVGGAQDEKVDAGDLRAMAGRVPQAMLTIVEGSGHMLPLEAPEALAEALRAYYEGAVTRTC